MIDNFEGNITTIIKFVVMTIAPAIGIDEATGNALVSVVVALIGFILAYFDAENPNTFKFLGNNKEEDGIGVVDEGAWRLLYQWKPYHHTRK